MSRWVRTICVVLVLLIPGGLLALLAFAFARALLNRRRLLAGAKDSPAEIGQVLAGLRLKDVLRELRAAI